jgi:hypothetical protein
MIVTRDWGRLGRVEEMLKSKISVRRNKRSRTTW